VGLLRRYLAFRIHREFLDYPAADPGVHRCQPTFPHRADLLRHTAQSRREKFCLAAVGTGGAVFRGGGIARLLEGKLGDIQHQDWEFYAVNASLFVVFAYPGFVYRYLWRRRGA